MKNKSYNLINGNIFYKESKFGPNKNKRIIELKYIENEKKN